MDNQFLIRRFLVKNSLALWYNLFTTDERRLGMDYQAKTLHLSQKFEDIESNDRELTTILNAFGSKGYKLDKVIPDERYVSDRDAKKVFILIFRKDTGSPAE